MGEKKDVHDEKTGISWPCFELMNMNEPAPHKYGIQRTQNNTLKIRAGEKNNSMYTAQSII